MANGESYLLFNRGNEVVVLLKRPRTGAFPRKEERTMGASCEIPRRGKRHVRNDMAQDQKDHHFRAGQSDFDRDGRKSPPGDFKRVGAKS